MSEVSYSNYILHLLLQIEQEKFVVPMLNLNSICFDKLCSIVLEFYISAAEISSTSNVGDTFRNVTWLFIPWAVL